MSNELSISNRAPVALTATDFDTTWRVAKAAAASGMFPKLTPEAAFIKLLAGAEIGVGPVAALRGIHPISQGNGAQTIAYESVVVAAAIKARGYSYLPIKHDDTEAIIEFYSPAGKPIGRSSFSIADAKRAGLTGKNNWQNYPRNMLWARAMTSGVKWYCADAIGGAPIITPDEAGVETDENGSPLTLELDVTPTPSPSLSETDKAAALNAKLQAKRAAAKPAAPAQQEVDWNAIKAQALAAEKEALNLELADDPI